MSKAAVIQKLEKKQLKEKNPHFCVGDTISVHTLIREGNKERVQVFTGTVIARKGTGLSETFSIHRVAFGSGMERVFLLNSPRIEKIDVVKHGKVRRAKLYHLRGKTGKKARVKGSVGGPRLKPATTEAQAKPETQTKPETAKEQAPQENATE